MTAQGLLGLRPVAAKESADLIHARGQEMVFEEGDSFGGGLEETIRLRLEPEVDLLAGIVPNCGKIGDDNGKILGNRPLIVLAVDPRLKRAGYGADRSIHFRRQKVRKYVRELHR